MDDQTCTWRGQLEILELLDKLSKWKVAEEQRVAWNLRHRLTCYSLQGDKQLLLLLVHEDGTCDDEDITAPKVLGLNSEPDVGDSSQPILVRLGAIVHDCHFKEIKTMVH